jgi:hydrogenase expression/formation protein HypE
MTNDKILLGHGSGGLMMHGLIRELISPTLALSSLSDAAILQAELRGGARLAFSTDSYVVSPLFFPGGNIGDLAINGTVNDLAVSGAKPLWLTVGLIIEEGLPIETLKQVLNSIADAAQRANVRVVAGDTKVVNRGGCDQLFINTAGIGVVDEGIDLGPHRIKVGDIVIVSGMIGNHGIAVMAERNGLTFDPPVLSDTAPLNGLTERLLGSEGNAIKMMRDPTRGGVATTLKEIALESGLNIEIDETELPIAAGVNGACELLGLDPLYVANEGILIAIVDRDRAQSVLNLMRSNPLGKDAAIIGEVTPLRGDRSPLVLLRTTIGGRRIVEMLAGEQLTRIC